MILIIQICKDCLHNLEFVKPIEDIISNNNFEYKTVNYKDLIEEYLTDCDKVIISGTSLKDNSFINDINSFNWIKDFNKPVFGICGGMQILGLIFDGKRINCQEIGLKSVEFTKEFLNTIDKAEVYELHNYYVESSDFETYAKSDLCIQAFKHKKLPYYGVLFHPEVRNKKLIVNFANL